MTTMVRIASVAERNKVILEAILKDHNVTYRFDEYENKQGFHVFVALNHELYFREIISPEYRIMQQNLEAKFNEQFTEHFSK